MRKQAVRAVRFVALVGALVGLPAVVLAAEVRGSLRVANDLPSMLHPRESTDQASRSHYWEEWNGVIDLREPRLDPSRELAVVLTGSAPQVGEGQPSFQIQNGGLNPATLVVRVGSRFEIRNADGLAYELEAEGNSDFAPLQTAPGNTRPITLSEAGSWEIRDRVYPHVRGHVVALPDLVASAQLDSNGAFVFRAVPAGTYQLHVYQGAQELASQEVVVEEGRDLQVSPLAVQAASH